MKQDYSRVDKKIFDSLVSFVERKDHKGLYVMKVKLDDGLLYRGYLWMLSCKLDVKDDAFLQKYSGTPIWDVRYDDLNTHTANADGAVAITRSGLVIDDHRAARLLLPAFVSKNARSGTGHLSMATASLAPGVTTYVCSAEKKKVTTFRKGRTVDGLCYNAAYPMAYTYQ